MGKLANHVGEKFITNEGYLAEIIEYFKWNNCTIRLNDWNNTELTKIQYFNLKKGTVRNPYHPSVHGVGYFGIGTYRGKINGVIPRVYNVWNGVIERGYCKRYKDNHPTYVEVSVCKEWHNYQNFGKWYDENYKPEYMNDWELDKDILIKGNKIYSPETCVFVPQEINKLLIKNNSKKNNLPVGVRFNERLDKFQARIVIGKQEKYLGFFDTHEEAFYKYKEEKELWIKEVADKWKDLIDPRVYEAMYNYEVEIDD